MSDLKLKCTKIDFGWGSAPEPAGGAYSAPPDTYLNLRGPTFKSREGSGEKETGRAKGKDRGEREGRPPSRIGKVKKWQP